VTLAHTCGILDDLIEDNLPLAMVLFMDPSEEKKQDTPVQKKKSRLIPTFLLGLLLVTIVGIGLYFYSGSTHEPAPSSPSGMTGNSGAEKKSPQAPPAVADTEENTESGKTPENTALVPDQDSIPAGSAAEDTDTLSHEQHNTPPPTDDRRVGEGETAASETVAREAVVQVSVCEKPARQLEEFYNTLDLRPYISRHQLPEGSEKHFTKLIQKLLANPPQVTRESDDLYTILKNTAHFFRVSGKENILMMKGILDNEKGSVEQVLADYYFLITEPECEQSPIAQNIDHAALYEYACFFLNTMGGRLYLFRRDSLSRMVVTYYAVLLVDRANTQNNNLHGIALKPVIDMLIAEMEAGGSSLQSSEKYLDTLYDLKQKYQDE